MVYIAADGSVGGNKSLWTRITDFFRGMSNFLLVHIIDVYRPLILFSQWLLRLCFRTGLFYFVRDFFVHFIILFNNHESKKYTAKISSKPSK